MPLTEQAEYDQSQPHPHGIGFPLDITVETTVSSMNEPHFLVMPIQFIMLTLTTALSSGYIATCICICANACDHGLTDCDGPAYTSYIGIYMYICSEG